MTITNGYSTLAAVKARLKVTSTDATDDALIESLVEQASRLLDGECGRRFYVNSVDETRYYSSRNGQVIFVEDLVSVTTLKLDLDLDRTYEVTAATTDYDLLPSNSALINEPYTWIECAPLGRYTFPSQRKGIQIVGKFGFPAVPADIAEACEVIVIGAYHARFGENTTGAAIVTGAGVVLTPRDIPEMAQRAIINHKRVW
jgi:hypothetical protein